MILSGFLLTMQVKCTQCSYCSNKFDPFLDLSLEIAKADSVLKALNNFTAAELLDGGEKEYHCQRCKQKVRALKQLTVYKAPYVLTIHLKRFRAHDPGQKNDKKVQFGSTLDMKPFVSGSYVSALFIIVGCYLCKFLAIKNELTSIHIQEALAFAFYFKLF